MEPDSKTDSGSLDNRDISFGLCQVRGEKAEDRAYAQLSHSPVNRTFSSFSSFAVFDGHGGKYASTALKERLHNRIFSLYSSYLSNLNSMTKEYVQEYLLLDAIFCRSIRQSYIEFDDEVKRKNDSGSTAVSLFIFPRPDNSFRVITSWVGDSRGIACYLDDNLKAVSLRITQDHKPNLERECIRFESNLPVAPFDLPYEVDSTTFRNSSDVIYPVMNQVRTLGSNKLLFYFMLVDTH